MCLQLYKSTLALAQSDLNINGAQLFTSLFCLSMDQWHNTVAAEGHKVGG